MKKTFQTLSLTMIVAGVLMTGACAKKHVAQATPPPPPPPQAPTVALTASPDTVSAGQPITLSWHTTDANAVTITGLGVVGTSGSKQVTPADSTTYNAVAKGPGGEREASARVTVTHPVAKVESGPGLEELFARNVKDVYFDYDRYTVRADQANITAADAKFLNEHPNVAIVIEGHCDDRGSEEYNIALGDNRANSVKAELIKLGIDANRIKTISYGKEKPFCTDQDESCWSQNRRDHFSASLH